MKVVLAQINPTVGAFEDNVRKLKGIIKENTGKCDIIVFPEMVITGYPPQDLLLDGSFIQKAQATLDEIFQVPGIPEKLAKEIQSSLKN